MSALRTSVVLGLCLTGWSLAGQSTLAQSYEHIDAQAVKLQKQSATLYHELKNHFRHTRDYRHLLNDAAQIYRLAGHLHEVAHNEGDMAHMQDDLEKLDDKFHHLQDLVEDIQGTGRGDGSHRGQDHSRGSQRHGGRREHGRERDGHIHGDTRHVRSLVRSMEDTLHHLDEDLGQGAGRRGTERYDRSKDRRFSDDF